jgi:hypothetical protein
LRCICCLSFWFPCWAVCFSSLEEERVWSSCSVGASCGVIVDVGVWGFGLRVFDDGCTRGALAVWFGGSLGLWRLYERVISYYNFRWYLFMCFFRTNIFRWIFNIS